MGISVLSQDGGVLTEAIRQKVAASVVRVLKAKGVENTELGLHHRLYDDGLGLDSMDAAMLATVLENEFTFDPYNAGEFPETVSEIVSFYSDRSNLIPDRVFGTAAAQSAQTPSTPHTNATFSLELGMPHLGRNNLSESALFKAIGADRWRQIEKAGKTPSALIRDEAGERLYATFYYLELKLSPDLPLATFGENSTVHFVTDLSHYSKVYLDGRHSLVNYPDSWIRSSNVFIYQERGPSKLSVTVPVNMDFSEIPELPEQPDSLNLCRQAKARGSFIDPQPGEIELYAGEREFVYQIDADRDLNGAGLVYFANFISFLDLAERRLLSELDDPMPPRLLDRRSTYFRRIGYFGNAQSTDRLHILLKTRIRVQGDVQLSGSFEMVFDYRVLRSSDRKTIVVSSARKVISTENLSQAEQEWVSRRLLAGELHDKR